VSTIPSEIFLQGTADNPSMKGVTWCDHRIEDDDVRYVRAEGRTGISVSSLERVRATMTKLGIATDSSLEAFGAKLEWHLLSLCRGVDRTFARPFDEEEQK
jgi:hypothetical protein